MFYPVLFILSFLLGAKFEQKFQFTVTYGDGKVTMSYRKLDGTTITKTIP
jgi:hypothetical protein